MAMSAAKEGGKHEADDLAQQLVLGLHAAFDLGHQGVRKIQVDESLMDGFDIELSLGALVLEALLGFESAACSGFGLFLGVSLHRGHGEFLPLGVWLNGKATLPHLRGGCPMM
jgi:hypothetical protein